MTEPSKRRKDKNKKQVMTRMMDKVSDDFVTSFADTGIDEGPEDRARKAQLEAFLAESKAARAARDAREEADADTNFRGFAALLAGRKATGSDVKVGGMFARLFDDEKSDLENIDGVVKTRANKKRRGLYTSCMNKPVQGGLPFRPLAGPDVTSGSGADIASRVAAARRANLPAGADIVNPTSSSAGWKKIDAEPLSKLAEQVKQEHELQEEILHEAQARSVKDRSEAMSRMLPSGAREFTLPPMPSPEQISTLRKLANDGKGSKVIPASAYSRAQDEEIEETTPEVEEAPVERNLLDRVRGFIVSLFGRRS